MNNTTTETIYRIEYRDDAGRWYLWDELYNEEYAREIIKRRSPKQLRQYRLLKITRTETIEEMK